MRYPAWLFPLLVVRATAFPKPTLNLALRDSTSTPVCDMMYNGSEEEKAATWKNSGAKVLLADFLKSNGVGNWSDNFIQQYVKGSQGGSILHCGVLGSTACTPWPCNPDIYKPTEAFMVVQSMSVLTLQYDQLHKEMQDTAISSLAGDIGDVIAIYGPPPQSSNSYILTILIGAFVGGAALSGPHWKVGVKMTGMVGLLNIVAGIVASNPPETKADYETGLKEVLGDIFDPYAAALKNKVRAVFVGEFENLPDFNQDPASWIENVFDRGAYLDHYAPEVVTQQLIDGSRVFVKQAFVVQCLKRQSYYLSMRWDIKKEDCTDDRQVWMYDRCNEIVKSVWATDQGGTIYKHLRKQSHSLPKDLWEPLVGTYGVDIKTAVKNAVDCKAHGTGVPTTTMSEFPSFGQSEYPRCFFNFDVRDEDENGQLPEETNTALQNDNGYVSGECGVHIRERKPEGDQAVIQLEATIKDSMGTPLTTATFQDLSPTAVVKGKESDDNAHLPYDFYMAAPRAGDPDSTLEFWYSDQHWSTKDNGKKVFPGCVIASEYESNGIRDGDCGFRCFNPTSAPPASATIAHPLPTKVPYDAGWCTLHVTQRTTGGSYYLISSTVYDAGHHVVGSLNGRVDWDGKRSIKGILPHKLILTVKRDTVEFQYGDIKWSAAESGACSYGPWNHPTGGHPDVQMDCGFTCK